MDRKENPFDQFDQEPANQFDQFEVTQSDNPFDQFDQLDKVAAPVARGPIKGPAQRTVVPPAAAPVAPVTAEDYLEPATSAPPPLSEAVRSQLDRKYDVLSPQDRDAIIRGRTKDGRQTLEGMYFAYRDKQFAARDADTAAFAKQLGPMAYRLSDLTDPRKESRARMAREQGASDKTAENIAAQAAIEGLPAEEVLPQAKESKFDFDLAARYKDLNPVVRGAVKGYYGYKQSVLGLNQALGDLVGATDFADTQRAGAETAGGSVEAIGERPDYLSRNFEGAVSSVVQNIPGILGGIVTGGALVPLSVLGVQSFGQNYTEGVSRGLTRDLAAQRAGVFAAFEILGERFGLSGLAKPVKDAIGKKDFDGFIDALSEYAIKQVPGELLTTTGQFLSDKYPSFALNPQAGLKEYLQQAGDTLTQTIMQGGLIMGAARGARFLAAGRRPVMPIEGRQPPIAGRPPEEPPMAPTEEPPIAPSGAPGGERIEPTVAAEPAITPERVEPAFGAEPTIEPAVEPKEPGVPGMVTTEMLAPKAVEQPEGQVAPAEPPVPSPIKPTVAPPQEPSNDTTVDGMLPVNVPLKDLTLSKDVPQFKMGADTKGVVEPLGGKFERTGVAPIQVWRRLDGSLEVISGRHRLDLARRSGEKTIPAQIHDEAQGFTLTMAAILDAELNIRDEQGKVKDYVNYFKASGITPQDAESRGLLARSTGKRAYTIATTGSDELVAAIRNDQVGDEAAYYIALNAPNDPRLQAVGLQAIQDGKSANLAVNTMLAMKALGMENNTTTDMFGFDDSAVKEATAMAQVANKKQREIQTRLAAITGAAKNPAVAKAEGIDIRDPEAVNRRIGELRQMKAAWDNWATSPELIGEIRQARGVEAPGLTLRGETEEEIRAREEAAAAEEQRLRSEADAARRAEQAEVERKRAEETTDLFQLGQTAEQQMSGMGDLFAEPAAPAKAPREAPEFSFEEGARVRFLPTDTSPLGGGVAEGQIIGLDKTSGENYRVRLRLDKDAPQGGGKMERVVYSNAGTFEAAEAPAAAPEAADMEQLNRLMGELQKARSEQEFTDAAVALGESVPKQPFLGVQLKELSSGVRFNIARSSDGNRIVFNAGYDDPDGFEIARKPNQAWKLTKTPRFAKQIIERNQAAPVVEKPEAKPVPQKPAAEKAEPRADFDKRAKNAIDSFVDSIVEQFDMTPETALAAFNWLRSEKLAEVDPVLGKVNLKDGRFWDGEILRRAALETEAKGHEPGATDEDVKAVGEVFEGARAGQEEELHRLFDKPKEVVRLTQKDNFLTPAEAKKRIAEWKKNAEAQGKTNANSDKVVLSLFDLTGAWSEPWLEAGYQVYRFDIQDQWTMTDERTGEELNLGDINNFSVEYFEDLFGNFEGNDVHAILAACPCTDFASSGARHFKAKDASGQTMDSVQLVQQTLATIEYFRPAIWAIENPVGRIEKLTGLPPWSLSFDPYMFGDPYTKKTLLWGRFNANLPTAPVDPVEGSKMHRMYGGKSLATKNARSVTPEGFAYAFFQANNAIDHPVMALANIYDRLNPKLFERAMKLGVSEQDIRYAIDDAYYSELDDAAAEAELVRLANEAQAAKAPKPKAEKPAEKPAEKRQTQPTFELGKTNEGFTPPLLGKFPSVTLNTDGPFYVGTPANPVFNANSKVNKFTINPERNELKFIFENNKGAKATLDIAPGSIQALVGSKTYNVYDGDMSGLDFVAKLASLPNVSEFKSKSREERAEILTAHIFNKLSIPVEELQQFNLTHNYVREEIAGTPDTKKVAENTKKVQQFYNKTFGPAAAKPAEKLPYTKEQREDAEIHAKEVGGEIAWQRGEYALIRGYSVLTGDPVYAPTIGSSRARVDISSFTGKQIPDDVKKEMLETKERLEREAAEAHAANPFIKFKDGIALSEDIPADLAGVIRGWKDLLKLDAPIYVSTLEAAKSNRDKFTGPHRRIGSGTLDENERGSMRRMSDGSYYILFERSTSPSLMLETIAHEMGHAHQRLVYEKASDADKVALREAHKRWLESQKGKTAKELVEALRTRATGRQVKGRPGLMAEDLTSYWKSFSEWYADQTARWAVSAEAPVSVVEKFFKRLGNQLRRFYQSLRGQKYLPDETFREFIERAISPTYIGLTDATLPSSDEAQQQLRDMGELPQTITVDGVDRPTRNSDSRLIHPTESGVRNFWRWFGDSKVVDENGQPLVMYHGTDKDIVDGLFRVNPRLPAIFLTPDTAFANMYAADDMAYFEGKPIFREGANVISVYAQAKNPFDFNNQKHIAAVVRQLEDSRDRKRFRQGASEGRWQDIEDFMGFIEQAGFDSMYLMERGRRNLAVFSPTQIKSATGNLGAFAPTEPSIIADIESTKPTKRMSDEDIRDEQIREYSALRQRLAAVPRRIATGKSALPDGPAKGMTELERIYLKALVDRAQDLKAAIKISAPRLDSPEQFLARALKEYDAGNISKEVLDVIQAAYKQQPGLLNGLKLSIKQAPEGAERVAGAFLNMSRIVRLYKGSSGVDDPKTIRHELTHSLEQMMTPEQRGVIIDKWQDDLAKAIRKHKDAAHQKYFEALLKFLDKPTMENYKAAIAALPSYDMYQFITPSEYWAVNAENLMASQLGGPWQRFKAAMKRMFEALKDVFGFDNKYVVQRVFKDIMTGSKERVTTEMLADRAGIAVSPAQNIEEDKTLIEKYKRPKTPMLDKKPLATFLLDQFKNGKDLFKDFVENPKEAAADAGNSLIDGALRARMATVWYGAGLESRDFAKYGGQLRTSEDLATASVALDNAIRSGNIGVEVIFRGGLKFDKDKLQLVAVETKKGMRGVYDAERRLKDKLGNQLGTDIIQGYLEAKRSISIMNEFYDRQAAYEGAKENLKMLREQGASEKKIKEAVALMESAERSLESVKKAVSSVTMTEDEMYEFAARDKVHPELREIMDNWTAANQNLLRIWRDVGLLSPERYEALASIPDYVPWYRIMQDEEDPHTPFMSTTRGLTNIGREKLFKRTKPTDVLDFKGKEGKKVLDKSGNLIGMSFKVPPSTVLRVEVDGEKIKANDLSVTDDGRVMVNASIDDASLVVFKVTRPIQNIVDNMTQNVMRMTMNAIRQYAAGRIVSEYATRDPQGRVMTFPKEDLAKGRFSFVINGQRKVVEISDPLPLGAIYGMDSLNLKMFALPAAFANFFRRTITLSGVFQLKQVFKDAPTAAAVTGVRNPAALILGTYKGLITALLQPVGKKVGIDIEPAVDILKAAGIGGFQNPSRTPEAEVKRRLGIMNRNVFDFVIKALDHIGDSADMAQRIAVYKRVMSETGNETQALYQAANVINFLHHGSSGTAQTLVKTVPFMGAYANAMDVLVNALIGGGLKGMSRRKAVARLGVTTGMLVGITLLYTMLVNGDDDYEELDDQTKLRNFIIPGTDIMLPMNTSYAFFWKAMTEMLYNEAIKKATPNEIDQTRLKKALSTAARDMLLGPEPVPQIIKGPAEIAIGYNFFTGRDIIPEGLKNVETFQQYTAATSELGKWFSSYTEVPGTDGKRILSPIEADHLIRSTFGTAGALGQWVTNRIAVEAGTRPELTEKEAPITGAFLRPEVDRGREDLFYDLRDRVNQKYNTLRELERDDEKKAEAYDEKYEDLLDLHKDVNKIAADLSDINAEIRELSTSKDIKMTPAERRAEIRALQQEKKEVLDDIYELRKEAGL